MIEPNAVTSVFGDTAYWNFADTASRFW